MTGWLRLWHDMPTDPKWRVIARKSGQPLTCVIALFNIILINASRNTEDRGSLRNWSNEDAAAALDMIEEDVAAIIKAMDGKVIKNGRLSGWETRQPKREDGTIAQRKIAWRERKIAKQNATERAGTQRNAPDTDTDTDTDTDKNHHSDVTRGRATVSDEQRIAEAMAAECGFPTPQDWPPGWCGAPMWVRRCLDDGWPEAVMLATAKAVARKKTGGAIEHYRYLEKPLASAVALSRAPLPKVEILPQEVVRTGYAKQSGLDHRLSEQRDAIDALDDLIERERSGSREANLGGDDAAECGGSKSVRGGDAGTILELSAARRRDGG